jgi:hypothetical protein
MNAPSRLIAYVCIHLRVRRDEVALIFHAVTCVRSDSGFINIHIRRLAAG